MSILVMLTRRLPSCSRYPPRRKGAHLSIARDMLRETLNVLDDLRSRGALDASKEPWAREIAGEIAKCDTALAK